MTSSAKRFLRNLNPRNCNHAVMSTYLLLEMSTNGFEWIIVLNDRD